MELNRNSKKGQRRREFYRTNILSYRYVYMRERERERGRERGREGGREGESFIA
jgi:hypothetical protein